MAAVMTMTPIIMSSPPTVARVGVGTEAYLNEMLAAPFEAFTFSPAGASVYQLGSFGTARKELKALVLTP